MGTKDEIRDTIDKLAPQRDGAAVPRRQPDGDPPVPPVQVPDPRLPANGGPSAAQGDIVTAEDLRDLLEAPDDAALVVQEGHARVVEEAAAGDALPILHHEELTTMLDGPGADPSDETLGQLAAGLDDAVRQQGV